MFKYFVRFQYSYYPQRHTWDYDSSNEMIEECDSIIITSETELDDIHEVRKMIQALHKDDTYYDIISMNRL